MTVSIQGFKLSPQQKRLWHLQRDGSVHEARCAVVVRGELDERRFRRALEQVVARHEMLRTKFLRSPGIRVPVQAVAESAEVVWHDCATSGSDLRSVVSELEHQDRAWQPDLESGAVVHASMAVLGDHERVLWLTLPALCADAVSLSNLVAELASVYAGSLPDEEQVQYAQFAEWKHQLLEDDEGEVGRQRWRQLDLDRAAALRLPNESGVADGSTFTPARVSTELSADTLTAADALAAAHETSAEVVLLACWQALVARLTGEMEPMIGCVLDGRSYEDLCGVVGLLAETVPVPCQLKPDHRFEALLRQTAEAYAEAYEWQEYFPTEELLDATAGRLPMPVAYRFQELPAAVESGDVQLEMIDIDVRLEHYSAQLEPIRNTGGLKLWLRYDAQRLREEDAAALIGQLTRVVRQAAAEPGTRIADFEIVGEHERQQLVDVFNRTRQELPTVGCLSELFERQADRTPDAAAVAADGELLNYRELDRRANQLARHLRSLGVGPEVRVALLMERSVDMVAALLGILKAGGAYLPLDTTYPAGRLAFMVEDAAPAVMVTQERLLGSVPLDAVEIVTVDGHRDALARHDTSRLQPLAAPDNLAYVIYTSGSTGTPKGVMVSQRGLLNYLTWAVETYSVQGDGGAVPLHSPLGFDLTVTSLFVPLLAGATVELLPEELGVDGLAETLRSARSYGLLKLTPGHLDLLREQLAGEASASRVEVLILGGEALRGETAAGWLEHSPETRIYNEYGPTETVVGSCIYQLDPQRDVAGAVPIGKPIANTCALVLDPRLRLVPVGVVGELYLGGIGVSRGYLERPGLTAERFVPDPLTGEAGARLYRSGDLVRSRRDGNLEFIGRNDHQVKVRGFRIELGEVEASLGQHPAVRELAAAAPEDASGERRLVAYLAAEGDERPNVDELRGFLMDRVPEHMVPSLFLWMEALPLTANGKVDRRLLPAPEAYRPDLARSYVAPSNPLEEMLAVVWTEVLAVDRVGIHDSFFALGGDSIRSVRVVAAAKKRGLNFSVQDLFTHQTIHGLSGFLERASKIELGPSARVAKAGEDADLAELVGRLENLSTEQVREELAKRIRMPGKGESR